MKVSFRSSLVVIVAYLATPVMVASQSMVDSGWYWQNPLPQGNDLWDVHFTDASTGTAVGAEGTILRTTDGGVTWVAQESGTRAHLMYVAFSDTFTGTVVGDERIPESFGLSQNYPNPFKPATTISYALPSAAHVTLTVVDLLGRRVRELASGLQPAGYYEVNFDATNLPSGVYFYRLQAGDLTDTKRMVIAK